MWDALVLGISPSCVCDLCQRQRGGVFLSYFDYRAAWHKSYGGFSSFSDIHARRFGFLPFSLERSSIPPFGRVLCSECVVNMVSLGGYVDVRMISLGHIFVSVGLIAYL